MPIAKITKSFVDNVPYTKKGQVGYCDKDLNGFYVSVGMQTKTYFVQKDIRGRSKRHTIGRHGHFTAEQARKIAKEKLFLMAQGINPDQQEKEELQSLVTLKAVLQNYQETRKNLRDSTKHDYEYLMNKYLPDWLNKPMIDIDKNMVIARHTLMGSKSGPATANGVMRILRALFNHAHATYDICAVNPVSYLSKTKAWFPEKRRRTYIKPHQLKAWWEGVQSLENGTMRDFLTFLLFTGLRRGEAASLRWQDIDFKDRTFTINKTKNGDPLTLPLSDFLFDMFEARHELYKNHEFVFPGSGQSGHLIEPKKGIWKVIEHSSIQFTCHDLRRTNITIAESLGLPYYALKQLMNHRSGDVTSGYIVVDVGRLREPVQRIANYILEQVDGSFWSRGNYKSTH